MLSDIVASFRSFLLNFPTVLSFALLFVFVLPFIWVSNTFISSGTVFLDYGFINAAPLQALVAVLMVLAFLFFYSVFVSLLIFAVRKEMGRVKVNYYLKEKIHRFAFKYFYFAAFFTLVASVVSAVLIMFSVQPEIVNVLLLLASSAFIFVPQALVVDEESLSSAVSSNFEFILKNPASFAFVFVFGFFAVAILQLLEFAVDYFFLAGNYLSIFIAVMFLVPFMEVLKTVVYAKRFTIFTDFGPEKN